MPIIGTDEDQEGIDPNQQTHGAATYAPGGVTPSGGSSGFVGGGGGASGGTTSATPTAAGSGSAGTTSGSNYTNLLSYLGANQGAGSTMGGALNDVATGVGKQAQGDLGSYQSGAMKDAQNATVNVDPTKVAHGTAVDQGIMGQIASGVTGGGVSTKTNADGSTTTTTAAKTYNGPTPSIVDPTAQNVSYGGPTDSQHQTGDTAAAQTSAYGDLARLAGYGQGAAGGTSGNAALLGNLYRQPSYTSGEKTFDAAILGGTSGGQDALKNIGQTAATGAAAGKSADQAVDAADTAAQQTTQKTAQTYTDAYNDATKMNAATRAAYQQAIANAKRGETAASAFTTAAPAPAPAPAAPAAVDNSKGSGISQVKNAFSAGSVNPTTPSGARNDANAGSPITLPGTPQQTGQQIVNDVVNAPSAAHDAVSSGVSFAHKHGLAHGGEVGDDDDTDDSSGGSGGGAGGLAQAAGKLAPLVMMLMKDGGPVPGKALVSGDSPQNDRVPALLSAKEIVLPRTVTLADDAPEKAAKFVKKVKEPAGRYDALVQLCKGGMR